MLLFTIATFLTFTSEINPPYLWHKPQKTAETQSFSPLLSNINQGNNDFQYVPVLNTILNSPLEVEPEAYAVFSDGTLTFYYDGNKPDGAFGMEYNDWGFREWNSIADKTTKVVFNKSFKDYRSTSYSCWFQYFSNLTEIVGMKDYLNTSATTDFSNMFRGCRNLTSLDLSGFNTKNITSTYQMFDDCISLETIYVSDNWNTNSVTSSESMFWNCTALFGSKGTHGLGESGIYARIDGGDSAPGYFTKIGETPFEPLEYALLNDNGVLTIYYNNKPNGIRTYRLGCYGNDAWKVKKAVFDNSFKKYKPKTCYCWFNECNNLAEISGIENLNTEDVINMSKMFWNCHSLSQIDLSGFNTSKVTDMSWMFYSCRSLTELDLTSFNTENVTDMSDMFIYCSELKNIKLETFNTTNVTKMNYMFADCMNLKQLNLGSFNTSKVSYINSFFRNCSSLKTIYVDGTWNLNDNAVNWGMFQGCGRLYGGMGTGYESEMDDGTYAHIDGGKENPGYFTKVGEPAYKTIQAYAVLEDGTLSFHYDKNEPENSFALNIGDYTDPTWKSKSSEITKVIFNKSFADYRPTTCYFWFSMFTNLTEIEGLENLNTSEVTNMAGMFQYCHKLTSLDLSTFNTENVTDMHFMLRNNNNLTSVNLSSFNTSNVTNMNELLCHCRSLTTVDLSNFDTKKVVSMNYMFYDCGNLKTIYVGDNWNIEIVTDSEKMFEGCDKLYGGKGSSVAEIGVYDKTYARIDGGKENSGYFTKVGDEPYIAPKAYAIFNNGTLTFYYDQNMPDGAVDMNINNETPEWLSYSRNWNIQKVVFDETFKYYKPTTCACWFQYCSNLTEIVGMKEYLNTEKVISMQAMFLGCRKLTYLDLSNFDTKNLHNIGYMFSDCNNLKTIYVSDKWSTDLCYTVWDLFSNCPSLYGGQGTHCEDDKDIKYARIDGGKDNPGYFTRIGDEPYMPMEYAALKNGVLTLYYNNDKPTDATIYHIGGYGSEANEITKVVFDDSFKKFKPTSCAWWFYQCSNLEEIVGMAENLNTENVTDMHFMFAECNKLVTLDLSNFHTENVTNMQQMFDVCQNLNAIDLSKFNTENVTYMHFMFNRCKNLKTLDLSSFNTKKVSNMAGMFVDCSNLKTIYVGDNWTTDAVEYSENMFGNCSKLYGSKGSSVADLGVYDKTYARIDGGKENPGYFTKVGDEPYIAPEAYVVLDDEGTLTFKYDKNKPDNAYDITDMQNWQATWRPNVKKAVFDESFRDYKPISCYCWFYGCYNMTKIEGIKENLNTKNVRNMAYMFDACNNLESLELSNFKTENVWDMYYMFGNCSNLQTIYVSDNWTTKNVTESEYMFNGCPSLYGGKGSNPDALGVTDATYARIDGGESAPGYFTKVGEQPWVPVSIDLTTLPNKTEYNIGDDLNLEGGKLTATFPDNSTKTASLSNAKVSGFDNTKIGEQKITVSWLGLETDFTVTVKEDTRKVTELYPSLEYQVGTDIVNEWFGISYDNGDWGSASFSSPGVEISGLNTNVLGVQDVTITYKGYTWQGQIEIYKPIEYLSFENLSKEVKKNTYLIGTFTAHYTDGTSEEIDISKATGIIVQEGGRYRYDITYAGLYNQWSLGEYEITINYHNSEAKYTFTIIDAPVPFAVFDNGTLTFYYDYDKNKPAGAYGMRTDWGDGWYEIAGQITKVVFNESFADYRPTSCTDWFGGCINLTSIDFNNLNTENVKYMGFMFIGCSRLTSIDLSNLNTENVMIMDCMFNGCSSLTSIDLSNFNTANVTSMWKMFDGCSNLQTIYVGNNWTTKNVTDSRNMFNGCNNLYGGKGSAYNENFTDATYARIDDPENGKPGYFTKSGEQPFTPAKPYVILVDKTITFYTGETIPEGAIELQPSYYFNTPWLGSDYETIVFDESFKNYKPTSTATWFLGLFNLKEIKGLENLNTEKVTDMQFMFNGCSLIESLDLSGFDVSNVTDMTGMFTNCFNLHTIFVGDNWNLSDNLSSINMFAVCYSLYGEQGSMPESYKIYDASMARIDGGDNAPGYFTKKGNSKATVTSIDFSVNPYSEHTLGEPINRQSGILNVYFNNREAQYLQYNHVNITPSGYDSTRVGKQTVTVKLLNATTTYEVNVTAKDTSYAYLDDNGVLTLYYGEYQQGALFGSENLFNNPGIVKKVIIDKSFANFHPTTCANWFQFFNYMTEIKGLENLNTQYVTDMSRMFYSLQSLTTIDVSKLNTENVTSMSEMFTDCNSLTTLDVSNFNTENVTSMSSMFGDCENLKTIYVGDKWTTKNVTESENMFKYSNNLYGGKGTAYDENFINATYARIDGGADAPGYFTKKDAASTDPEAYAVFSDGTLTFYYDKNKPSGAYGMMTTWNDQWYEVRNQIAKVVFDKSFADYRPTSCAYWFYGCSNLTIIEGMKEYLNTEKVTDMCFMFNGCSNLTTLDVSNFNTEKVIDIWNMFRGCSNLTTLDVSNFKTDNVTNMVRMFDGCSSLQTIYVSDNWTTKNVTNSGYMFNGCYSLYGGKGTAYNADFTDATYARIDDHENGKPGYFTKSGEQPYEGLIPYAVFSDGTLTFYYDKNKPSGAYGMRTNLDNQWYDVADKITKVVFDKSFADYRPTSCAYWFYGCSNLTIIEGMKEYLNTEKVTNMGYMFGGCNSLTTLDISNFKTENVTSMGDMFYNCSSLTTLDVSNFKTDNVTSMYGMFLGCSSLTTLDISNFKTDNVTDMGHMFFGCSSLTTLDISNFNTDNVMYMNNMFDGCSSLTSLDVSNFKTDNVTYMGYMFSGCSSLTTLDVSNFKIDNVTDMGYMFGGCSNLTSLDVSNFKTDNVTRMGDMFYNCRSLQTIYVGDKWTTKNVTQSEYMFYGCNNLYGGKGTAHNADVIDVTYARIDAPENGKPGYFTKSGEPAFVPPIPYAVFSDGTLTFYYDGNKPEGAYGMGYENYQTEWHEIASDITKVVFDKSFADYRPTSCNCWFLQCSNLTEIQGMKENLNTENVTDMGGMFLGCSNLTTLDVSNFKTDNVTNMNYMFDGCSSLTTLDVSNFNTDNVMYMSSMFGDCDNLKTIYVGDKWTTKNVTNSGYMFNGCYSLYGGKGTAYNADFTDATYARIDDPENGKPGYFTKSGEQPYEGLIPYAVFSDGTLTFYYDYGKNKPEGAFFMNDPNNFPQWKPVASKITKAVFDESFAEYTPKNCANWFYGCNQLSEIKSMKDNLNTNYVTRMDSMFYGCENLVELDLSNFNTEKVTNINSMFKDCISLKNIDLSSFNTQNVTDMGGVFYNCSSLESLDLSSFNTENVTWINSMFRDCIKLKSLDLKNFNTDKIYDMGGIFYNCSGLKNIDISGFNTENVTKMDWTFYNCKNLKSLDLSNFDNRNVRNHNNLFYLCNNLTTIYVGSRWTTMNVEYSSSMFSGCTSLIGGKGTTYDEKFTDATYARIDDGADAPGYFTYKMVVSPIDTTLTSSPTKLEYIEGQELDLTGGEITITYNDETTETIDLTDANVTLSEFDNTKTGDQTIKVFLKGEEVGTFTVNVKAKSVVSIALTAPKKLEYVEGTSLDLKGGKITITYDNETTEDIPLTDENVTISEFDNTTLGEKTLTVNYNGEKVDNFKINVVAKSVASIRVTKSPEKLTYKKGEVLSVDDGEITVTYNNQTTEILAFTAEGVTMSDIDNTKLGAQSITVTYSEKVATFNVTVVPDKEILSITISKLPKTEYFAGEDLNISDGELTITYSDETTETAKLSIAKLSGFNSETVGKQTIKVTYLEKETTFEVNVKAVEIVSIELTTAPTKLEYIENEEFSAEGGEITVTFNNEATQKVALTDEKVSISGFDNSKIGEQTLKVVYNEKETELKVNIVAKSLVKIAISTQPSKVEYLEGENFSADGGEFVAYYNNNSSDTLDLSKATISGFDNSKIGEQTLKVVYNEKTAEIKVTVSAKPEPQPEPEPVVENPYTKPELKDGFYQISTAEELLWFVFDVNSGDTKANAALTQDIVFNEDCLERVLKLLGISKADGDLTVWQPIGTSENAFAGIFDGQGHSISGLFINDKTQDNVGLFGATTSDAVIKNVAVVDSYISGGENVGAICGKSEGKIENCYSLSEVKGTENVNGIAGKVESGSTVENCYYLAETPKENDPQAKTAAEFKSGEVAELLSKGSTAWKDVKELPGVESVVVPDEPEQPENPENPETATFDIVVTDNVKIWSFEKTIYVENSANEIVIVDMTGKVVKRVTPISDRMEIQLNKGGIYIVKTGLSTKKVVIR